MKFGRKKKAEESAEDIDKTVPLSDLEQDADAANASAANSPVADSERTGSSEGPGSDLRGAGEAEGALDGRAPSSSPEPRSVGIPKSHSGEEDADDFGKGEGPSSSKAPNTGSQPKIVTKVEYADYQPRQVHLVVSRIEPWTVMKVTFLLSVCFGIAMILASILVWLLLNSIHVFSSVENFIKDIDPTGVISELIDYIRLPRVMAISTILSVANVILMTAFATVGALLYNLAAALVGGVKLALMDD